MSFRMQLASLPQGPESMEALSFATVRRDARGVERSFDPVLAGTVGSELEYGSFFAYLFRRFGHPNQPWDGRTELARYLLSTRRHDLFLSVVPRFDARADLSLVFLGPAGVARAAWSFSHEAVQAWEDRAIAHRAAQGVPKWAWDRGRATGLPQRAAARSPDESAAQWREVLRVGPSDSPSVALRKQQFLRRCWQAYARVEPQPPVLRRPVALKDWSDADPLKPYAFAAVQALRDLMRDVRLGEGAIDVFGAKPATARMLAGAKSSGSAWGCLAGQNARLVADLQAALFCLGRGDARLGLARGVALLRRACA